MMPFYVFNGPMSDARSRPGLQEWFSGSLALSPMQFSISLNKQSTQTLGFTLLISGYWGIPTNSSGMEMVGV